MIRWHRALLVAALLLISTPAWAARAFNGTRRVTLGGGVRSAPRTDDQRDALMRARPRQ